MSSFAAPGRFPPCRPSEIFSRLATEGSRQSMLQMLWQEPIVGFGDPTVVAKLKTGRR
jgi:hypothetical protein